MIPGIVAGAPANPLSIPREIANGPVYIAHRGCSLIYPEMTNVAYEGTVADGLRNLESDLWITSSGSLVNSHDSTATYTTTSTAAFSSLTDAAVAALTVDSGTWFGVTFSPINITMFADVLADNAGSCLFWPEVKVSSVEDDVVTALQAANIPWNQACVSSFTVGDLGDAHAAGYLTKLLGIDTSVLATAQANNVDYIAYRITASSTLFTAAVAAGVPVFAYTVNRRLTRDTLLGYGVSGFYSDDPVYLMGDTPMATTDDFASQRWMHGMVAGAAADNSRPTLAERGQFFSPDFWGYAQTTDAQAFCLQGWACPIKGDPGADDYTIDLKITFDANSAGGTSRWAGLHIAAESQMDRDYNNEATGHQGYAVLFRKNGTLDIYREDTGGFTNVGTSAGSAITTGTEVRFKVIVSPTAITVQRLNSGGTVVQTASTTDTTYRGGYFHLGRFGLACKFRDITIT